LVRGVPQALFKRGGGSVFLGGGDPFHIEFSSKLLWRANYHLNRPNYTKKLLNSQNQILFFRFGQCKRLSGMNFIDLPLSV
jgi:hypothetical protein